MDKSRKGFGWSLLATVVFWGVLLLGPFALALWDALSIFRLDQGSLTYAIFLFAAQPVSAGLAFYLSKAVVAGEASLVPSVNAVVAASMLGVFVLIAAATTQQAISYILSVIVLVLCAAKGFRTARTVGPTVPSPGPQSSTTSPPPRSEPRPPCISRSHFQHLNAEELDGFLEQAYKEQYLVAKNAYEQLIMNVESGAAPQRALQTGTEVIRKQYMQNVWKQATERIEHENRFRFSIPRDFPVRPSYCPGGDWPYAYERLRRSCNVPGTGTNDAIRQANRFDMYDKAAFDHAAEKVHGGHGR